MIAKVTSNFIWSHWELTILAARFLNQLFALRAWDVLLTYWSLWTWRLRFVISQGVISSCLFDNVGEVYCFVATLCLIEVDNGRLVLSSVLASFAHTLSSFHEIGGLRHVVMGLVTHWRKLTLKILAASSSFWCLNDEAHVGSLSIGYWLRKGSNIWNGKVVGGKWLHLWGRSDLTENVTVSIRI